MRQEARGKKQEARSKYLASCILHLASCILLSLLAAALLWGPGMVNTRGGGDSPFLLQRTLDMADSLRHGVFPPRWMAHAAYDLGYPMFNHYAALPYYLSGGLTALGLSPLVAIQATQTLGFVLAALTMALWAGRVYKSRIAVLPAVAAYTFAPFHLVNVYVRGDSLSEFYAFIWYPLILWALDRLAERPALNRIIAAALPYAALILTHNVSALIFSPFALLYGVVRVASQRISGSADRRISEKANERSAQVTPTHPHTLTPSPHHLVPPSPPLPLSPSPSCLDAQELAMLETNIDDLNPEIYEYVMGRLFDAGALDVFFAPIQMKKNRPATLLRVLCRPDDVPTMTAILFAETTTLGVREQRVQRHALRRESRTVTTPYGEVRVKVATLGDGAAKAAPEYEDCRRLAAEHGIPLREVYRAAEHAAEHALRR